MRKRDIKASDKSATKSSKADIITVKTSGTGGVLVDHLVPGC
jgi:hypothetical protein